MCSQIKTGLKCSLLSDALGLRSDDDRVGAKSDRGWEHAGACSPCRNPCYFLGSPLYL